ncbi:FliH/SctL family protein [Roseateles chitinivorans]|uniref:FliH/SctL family protein n=1 Tax=Roseateles chitinivorans TaxID=2917965 RepID=UPI003D66BDBF
MSRHNAAKPAPQVLKGLRLTTVVRGLPYHAQTAQTHAQTLAAKPVAAGASAAAATAASAASALTTPTPPGIARQGGSGASFSDETQPAQAVELEAQVAAALAEAERAGYQQGLAGGRKDAQQELAREREALAVEAQKQAAERQASAEAAIAALEQALRRTDDAQRAHRERVAAQAAGLAFEALCRVVGQPGAVKDSLLPLIDAALDRWAGAPRPTLRLSPDDFAALKLAVSEDRWQALMARVEAVADPSVRPMGVLIEDEDGGLDLGLDTQLRALGQAWTRALSTQDQEADRNPDRNPDRQSDRASSRPSAAQAEGHGPGTPEDAA